MDPDSWNTLSRRCVETPPHLEEGEKFELDSGKTSNMMNFCTYVQWVPQSDVVVAQSNDQLCVWYNTDHVEQVSQFAIQGDVEEVLRDESRTEVIVHENNARIAYELDSAMIEFGTALDDLNLSRAVVFLENSERTTPAVDISAMWKRLADVALDNNELLIAQRCYAGLNDFARVKYLHDTLEKAEAWAYQNGVGDGMDHYEVRARLALMRRDFKAAERLYLENDALSDAIEMYSSMGNWEAAIELATAMNYPDLESLKAKYYRQLQESGQDDKAAEIRVKEGDVTSGLELYLRSNQPVMASKLLMENALLLRDEALVERVSVALVKNEAFDKAGELFERLEQHQRAVECYRRAKAFAKAIRIARGHFPEEVVQLEEEWAQSLYNEGNFDAAISHFLESGTAKNTGRAVEAAIRAKEFDKALEILKALEEGEEDMGPLYERIAQHFGAEGNYDRAEKLYLDAKNPMGAVEMYNDANRWVDAFKLASEFFGVDESRELYLGKAEILEKAGRLRDAEELYVSIGEADRAIVMYRNRDRAEDLMRLVERFHSDDTTEMRKRLAEESERQGDLKAAEEQYLLSGDWLSAVNMYKEAEQWSDAYRIAKSDGDEGTSKQVAYLWAKSLGGDAAVKLLLRQNLLDQAIDFGVTNGDFDFVFELCRLGATTRLAYAHQKYAEHLEDAGEIERAEEFYLKAGRVKEAVMMHTHHQNWEPAERIAKLHSPDMLAEVYVEEAKSALEQRNPERAEGCLLRANRPDIILAYYRETGMWEDALRIARDYVPDMLEICQNEYEEAQLKWGGKGAQSFIAQAKEWERQNEYRRAVECYLKVDEAATSDSELIAQSQYKAGELVAKFLADAQSEETLSRIGAKLMELTSYMQAGEIFLLANLPQQAVEALVAAREWGKAKRVAVEMAPEMEPQIDEAYADFLRNQGRVGDLIDVDVVSAIDMMVEKGQWEKALLTAKQQNNRPLLDKYLMLYLNELLNTNQYEEAVRTLIHFGASTNAQSFNIYKRMIDQLLNSAPTSNNYEQLAEMRTMLLDINTRSTPATDIDSGVPEVFERYLSILHFYALHKALGDLEEVGAEVRRIRLQIMVSMVRNLDLLQPDRVLYEAGMACKDFGDGYEDMAFLLLNQYLDVVEAIDEGDPGVVDNSIFEGTDVPLHYSLPQQMSLPPDAHDEVKEWVLGASVGANVKKELKLDEQSCYEASSVEAGGGRRPICVITGYPALDDCVQFGSGKVANSWAWRVFNQVAKAQPSDELLDCQNFLSRWCGKS